MWKKLSSLSVDVVNHQTAYLDENLYIFGGYRNSRPLNFEKIIIYKLSSEYGCQQIQNIPTYNYNHITETVSLNNTLEPHDCYGHTVTFWNNKAILFGGYNSNTVNPSVVYVFIPTKKQLVNFDDTKLENWPEDRGLWLKYDNVSGDVPDQRDGHSVAINHDSLYLFGGMISGERSYYDNKLYKLDLNKWQWTIIYDGSCIEPLGRDFATLLAVENCLYLYGGRSSESRIDSMPGNDIYDSAVWKWDFSQRSTKRKWNKIHGGNGIIISSQYLISPTSSTHDLDEFDSILSHNNKLPLPRRSHVAMTFNNNMIIFGGLYETGQFSIHFNDIWQFNLQSRQWCYIHQPSPAHRSSDQHPPPVRRSAVSVVNGNCAILSGGITSSRHDYVTLPPVTNIIANSIVLEPNLNCDIISESASISDIPYKQILAFELYSDIMTCFSGSVTLINNINLKPISDVYLFVPQISLYQRLLGFVSDLYDIDQLRRYHLPTKIMYDLECLFRCSN